MTNKLNRIRYVEAQLGNDVQLLAYIRDASGASIESGTYGVTVRQDFGEYDSEDSSDGSAFAATGDDGTDPLWVPAIDGQNGYNFRATVDADLLPAIGGYIATATLSTGGVVQEFRISVTD